jgi:GT2 family glycosyltransferase
VRLSVVVPVHNDGDNLLECLSALKCAVPSDAEIVVVDDASTDNTPAQAAARGIQVVRRLENGGPAAARNDGARATQGDILFFVDADVVVAPDAPARVLTAFAADPHLAAVFGSYDARPRDRGVVSRYRNLLHHFVHQNGNPNASTFWAGCGAIRRTVFDAVGGFDATRFRRPSIEDIEMGYRLRAAGYRILLDRDLQGTHLKRWTLASVVRTDITRRAIPWAHLLLENRTVLDDLNLRRRERLNAMLVALAAGSFVLGWAHPSFFGLGALAIVAVLISNRELYTFLLRSGGVVFLLACIPLHWLYYVYSGSSYLLVWMAVRWRALRRPSSTSAERQG